MWGLRNRFFATNSNVIIPLSLQPDGVNLWNLKLRLFYSKKFMVWKDKKIRKSEFVAKTQFLCIYFYVHLIKDGIVKF